MVYIRGGRGRVMSNKEARQRHKESFAKLIPGIMFEAQLIQDEVDGEPGPQRFFIACNKDETGALEVIELDEDNKNRAYLRLHMKRKVERLTIKDLSMINQIYC